MNKYELDPEYINELSRFTIESDADAIFWLDSDGVIYRVNKAACNLLSRTREELVGEKIHELMKQYGYTEQYVSLVRNINALKDRRNLVREQEYKTRDGRTVILEISSHLVIFEGKEYICNFARDITERKRAQEALQNALKELESLKNQLHEENIYLQNEIKLSHNFEEIIGKSRQLHEVLKKVEQVAETDASVMISGETGSGKELIARAIHHISTRNNRPLVKINCAALPVTLIESELFGHEKGAYTGAFYRKIGRFELAHGGTVFLDEIGDLPMEVQVKLLRFLQEGEFERLGSTDTIKTDVRIITATNRNLENAVQEGKFREDLFYRLNVFPIHVPPLRERSEDIPPLVNYFVQKFSKKIGRKIDRIPVNVMNSLTNYHWPGNVRELENIIERAVIISDKNELRLGNWLSVDPPELNRSKVKSLKEQEKEYILKILALTNWRVSGPQGAAKLLDINPQTLFSRMKRLGIKRL